MTRTVSTLCAVLGTALGSLALPAWSAGPEDLEARLASESRAAEDRARDAGRKPARVIAFLGIEPGDRVVDLIAASGYYTEVLSHAVGPRGKVYAQNTAFVLQMRDGANDAAMTARLAGGRLPNVERLDREIPELGLADGSIDAAITALNFHDVYNSRGPDAAAAFLATVHAFLKPGGVLGLIDHTGDAGADNGKLHRIEEQLVRRAAEAAGFEVADSPILRNPDDDRRRSVFDPQSRGRTDRLLLRLRKPTGGSAAAPAPQADRWVGGSALKLARRRALEGRDHPELARHLVGRELGAAGRDQRRP